MEPALAQKLSAVAKEAYEASPQQFGHLAVVVTDADNPVVYAAPLAEKELTKNPAALAAAAKKLNDRLGRTGSVSHTHSNYNFAGIWVNLIALQADKDIIGDFSSRHTKEIQAVYTLNYQIGRHLVRNSHSIFKNKAESASDTFALLRHLQLYGKDTDQVAIHGADTAANLVLFANTAHYTANALQRARTVADEMGDDFFKLSVRDTAELAAKIADENYPGFFALRTLRDAFKPVAEQAAASLGSPQHIFNKITQKDPEASALLVRETVAVLKQHRFNAAIFNAGKQFLSTPNLKAFITAQAATGDKLSKDALALISKPDKQSLRKRIKTLAAER